MTFQIHITLKEFDLNSKSQFLNLCEEEKVKPLIINLPQGNFITQPMFTKLVDTLTLEDALNISNHSIETFKQNNFSIARIKVEVQPENDYLFEYVKSDNFKPYYEWHCKIIVQREQLLEELCNKNNAHLSLNSLDNTKYITIREYENKDKFYTDVKDFESKLLLGNWEIVKQKFEYCIYDSRLELDSGWAA